jgi:hypothetical protein
MVLSWFDNTAPPSSCYFPIQAFFEVVADHPGELEESTLQQISQVRWKNFQGGSCFIDLRMFIRKVWQSHLLL